MRCIAPSRPQHVAQRREPGGRVREMVENAGADDLIEGRPQRADALDGKLVDLEIVEIVFPLERLGVTDAGRAEVDARHLRLRPAQGVFGRLRRPAAGDQDRLILAVGLRGPGEVKVRAAPLRVLPQAAVVVQAVDGRRIGMPLVEGADLLRDGILIHVRALPYWWWVVTCRITSSRLNDAGFWRGGNLAKSSICAATSACIS